MGNGAFVSHPCIRHVRLLHAAASLAHAAGLSGTIREHLDGIRSQFVSPIFHVVSRARFKIGVAREGAREESP